MSFNFRIAILTIFTLLATFIMHVLAIRLKLYWTASNFDTLVHYVAGVSVGLFFIFIYPRIARICRVKRIFVWLTVFTFGVGIAWELFEVLAGFVGPADVGYWRDTITDLIADTLGGWTAYLAVHKDLKKTLCACCTNHMDDCTCPLDCECKTK